MEQSFIELPSFSDVRDLSLSVQAKVKKYRPLAGAPVGQIFSAQCINYFVPYFLGFTLFLFSLQVIPGFDVAKALQSGPLFWLGGGLLVWSFYFICRILFWAYLGTSLGEYCMGITAGFENRLPINAIVWESLHFVCPALWLFESGCRLLSVRMGVPYYFRYNS